jgi:hypothetical protein
VSVSHIAGDVVIIDEQFMRQRCGWCGETLLEYNLARVAVPVGTDPTPASWSAGSVVRVEGGMSATVELDMMRPVLPDDACSRNPLTFASLV